VTANKINTRKEILNRSRIIFACVALFGLYLVVSIFRLQHGMEKDFSISQERKNTRVSEQTGIRGNIYAGDGGLLATSVPTYDLLWDSRVNALTDQHFKEKLDSLSFLLARNFKKRNKQEWAAKLIQLRKSGHRYYTLLTDLSFDKIKQVKTWPLIREDKYKGGFWTIEEGKRMYFMGEMAKRAIGYTKNGVNVGLEGAFDSMLKGQTVQIMEQRLPGNIWRPLKVGVGYEAENGKDIVTTLDTRFQDITQYALNKALVKHRADHGCAIVMEVATGQIKAIANLKRSQDGNYYESMNYAVDQFMEPGSTFKIISALALLEDGEATPTDSIATHRGKIKFYNTEFKDDEHNKTIPKTYTLQECVEQSSNVGISQFIDRAYRDKPSEFLSHLEQLGLTLKPNFDIPSSNHPVVLDPNNALWSGVTLPSMSIGYATRLSPLQLLSVYNAIANSGQLMNPYLVKEIRQNGKVINQISPKIINKKICSKRTNKQLQDMLRGVVVRGTAQNAFKECLVDVAGKTGTARIINKNGRGYSDRHMASFVGYFPADKPTYSIIVVVNEPSAGDIYGAGVAAPVFRDIANKIYSAHIRIQPELIAQEKRSNPSPLKGNPKRIIPILDELEIPYSNEDGASEWVESQNEAGTILLSPISHKSGLVPDFKNMGAREALILANKMGLNARISGYGRVYQQSIKPSTRIHNKIDLTLFLKP
jgi:cell division protein FtsI (penicillin-binding protein 3)